MGSLQLLFVYPHDLVGAVVDAGQGPGLDPCHVGAFAFDGVFEATTDGVGVTLDFVKYDGKLVEIVEIDVPDLAACLARWRKLDGKPYGLLGSCVAGGIHDIFHRIIRLNFKVGYNCSETMTVGLRYGGLPLAPGHPAYCITPRYLLSEIYRLGGKLIEKGIYRAASAGASGGNTLSADDMRAGTEAAACGCSPGRARRPHGPGRDTSAGK